MVECGIGRNEGRSGCDGAKEENLRRFEGDDSDKKWRVGIRESLIADRAGGVATAGR